jgi:hypothetical protein
VRRRFVFPENHFRHSSPHLPVVINLRESQVFKWKVTKLLYCVIRRQRPSFHLFEKFADGLRVQEKITGALE